MARPNGYVDLRRRPVKLTGERVGEAEIAMEHWAAAAAASIVAIAMVVLVVLLSFRFAGPAPPYLFINRPASSAAAAP